MYLELFNKYQSIKEPYGTDRVIIYEDFEYWLEST